MTMRCGSSPGGPSPAARSTPPPLGFPSFGNGVAPQPVPRPQIAGFLCLFCWEMSGASDSGERGNAVKRFLFVLRRLFFVAGVARLRLYRGRRPNSGESGYQKSLTALGEGGKKCRHHTAGREMQVNTLATRLQEAASRDESRNSILQ